MTDYFTPKVFSRQDETLTKSDRAVFRTVEYMISMIENAPYRTDCMRANLNAYISEHARHADNTPRGTLITMLVYRFPQYVELRPIADALGVMPSSLRTALGLEAKR